MTKSIKWQVPGSDTVHTLPEGPTGVRGAEVTFETDTEVLTVFIEEHSDRTPTISYKLTESKE